MATTTTQDQTTETEASNDGGNEDGSTLWETINTFARQIQPLVIIGTLITQLLIIVGLFV